MVALATITLIASCTESIPAGFAPGVVSGAGLLGKTRITGLPSVGGITDIALARPRPGSNEAIIVAGTEGVAILEPVSYRLLETARLNDGQPPFVSHHIIDADGDGTVEFLREPHAASATALQDLTGRVLWTAEAPGRSFAHVAWGNLEGRGKLSFLLWRLLQDEVALHDASGRLLWTQRWEKGLSAVKILDLDGDGAGEIVARDAKGLSIRDAKGGLIRRQPLEEAGEVAQALRERDLQALSVKLEPGKPPYQASIRELKQQAFPAGFSATRLELRIHGPDGALVYEEVLASAEGQLAKGDGATASLPAGDGPERLLVAYGPDLWEYRLAGK